jgi:hypothetical protein
MDLRRIVEEVEERKRYELSLVGAGDGAARVSPAGAGAAGSLLVAVRHRMLSENPEADVAGIDQALQGPAAAPPQDDNGTSAPRARVRAPPGDDFIERYLEMSVEFEERFGVKGWADFVAKKTVGHRRAKAKPAHEKPKARPKGKRKAAPPKR